MTGPIEWEDVDVPPALLTLRCAACGRVAAHLVGTTWQTDVTRRPCSCAWLTYPPLETVRRQIEKAWRQINAGRHTAGGVGAVPIVRHPERPAG